jgi:arginyl-tRNA synthetase
VKKEIKKIIEEAINNLGIRNFDVSQIIVGKPDRKDVGDYFTNAAHVLAGKPNIPIQEKDIRKVAPLLKSEIEKIMGSEFDRVENIGGFINFYLSSKFFIDNLKKIDKNYGKGKGLQNKKIIVDYTDPNILKDFHIGHLMSNSIGESLCRIFEFQGAKVKRVCYQGDVGMHIAKAIWGKLQNNSLNWGQSYASGNTAYEENESAKKEITELNKKIYEKSDSNINKLYDDGKKESLKYFDGIYKKLGTKFDYLIFESQTADIGKNIVENGLKKGIFEKGENGAIIFKGEKYGLHTRVFINSEGLPTYEAKDLGLIELKYKKYKYDQSFVVTGNDINDYFKVMVCAMEKMNPKLAEKTKHIGHGMLRLPEGKMSSRTGKVITGESLIEKVEELVSQKIKDRELSEIEKKEIAENVSIGAIKYSILKQSIGSNIIYDFDKSISFEGDSGPYLQYSYARAESVLRKAKVENIKPSFKKNHDKITELEKAIIYFPEIVLKAEKNYEPHFIVLYLTELAGIFNGYYAQNKIVDKNDEFSPYKVALTNAFIVVMKNGMWLLGIKTLEKM